MKITIYELLDLIKDGKEPKQIVFDGDIYNFNKEKENYYMDESTSVNWNYVVMHDLSNRVEIIEDNKKIGKIKWNEKSSYNQEVDTKKVQKILLSRSEQLKSSIDEIIDKLNEMGDK